jgi:hypothetical protein
MEDLVVYLSVSAVVLAMMIGKKMIFFDSNRDKKEK